MTDDHTNFIDPDHTSCLCDVGAPDYIAATAVRADGSAHLLLARADDLGDESSTYDPTCSTVAHEQLGPLPLEVVRRITAAGRRARLFCGRPTKTTGQPCRIEVTRPGEPCGLHRTEARR
jgi:hypothetical protein